MTRVRTKELPQRSTHTMTDTARCTNTSTVQKTRSQFLFGIVSIFTLISLSLLSLSACSNNPMLVRIAYQRFPTHISTELSNLADFNQQQLDWIENASAHHHNWHRTTQLPLYVELINSLARQVQGDRTLDVDYFDSLIRQSHALLLQINQCNPARYASLEFQQLADKQVDQIRQNLQLKVNNNKKSYASNNREQRSQKRFNKIKKLFSYAKLNLNDFQKQLLKRTIEKQVSLGMRRFELTEQWNLEFVTILKDRGNIGFAEQVQSHIAKRWKLIEAAEPEAWAKTHDNWSNFGAELMASLTDKQRKQFGAWLAQMSRTLNTLANEKLQKVEVPSPLTTTCRSQA